MPHHYKTTTKPLMILIWFPLYIALTRQAVGLPATFQAVGGGHKSAPPFTFSRIAPECVAIAVRNFADGKMNT